MSLGLGAGAERDKRLPGDQGRQGQGARAGLPGGQDRGSPCMRINNPLGGTRAGRQGKAIRQAGQAVSAWRE